MVLQGIVKLHRKKPSTKRRNPKGRGKRKDKRGDHRKVKITGKMTREREMITGGKMTEEKTGNRIGGRILEMIGEIRIDPLQSV